MLPIIAFSQIKPNAATLQSNDWEVWQRKIPVSGGVRVGLMSLEKDKAINPTSFYVRIPKTNVTTLHVELSSKDGRYSAELDYSIDNIKVGTHQFVVPTKFKNELSNYKTEELVILATIKEDRDSSQKAYLLSSWHNLENTKGVIYINANVPSKLIVNNKTFDCSDVSIPTISFNKKCEFPIKELEGAKTIFIKQRYRIMGRIKFNSYELPIKY